ncbi:MAG: DUF6172 family protein [Porticoccaceae bacterium]|nr:DUF6172 family protein [Porticoccaceae bacterium]
MKKTFKLEHPKIKVPRIVDSVKHEIKKYLKKERKQTLPSGAKYWGFDCKLGASEETAVEVQLPTLSKSIDALVEQNNMTLYVEITAKALEGGGAASVEIAPEQPESLESGELPQEELSQKELPQEQQAAPTPSSIWPTQPAKSSQED